MKNNGYKVEKCECGKHYMITNPYIKNESQLPCGLIVKMTKKQAIARTLELPSARLIGGINNYNSNFSY